MNWGKGIAISLGTFIVFIVVMVSVMMQEDDSLMEEDYYEQGEAHTEHMVAERNAADVGVVYAQKSLRIEIPAEGKPEVLELRHMGDSKLDRNIKIARTGESEYNLDLSDLPSGLWYAQLKGKLNQKDFLKKFEFTAP